MTDQPQTTDAQKEAEAKRDKYIAEVIDQVNWDDKGLIPAVVQDVESGLVLMVAWMNAEALRQTLITRETHFWSRSREELWHKGETSGNTQSVMGIYVDCDNDTLLVKAFPKGPACHTGESSCFYRPLEEILDSDSE